MSELFPSIRFDITVPSGPGWREPPRMLYDCELVYVKSGAFQLRIEKEAWTLGEGDIAIIGPFMDHESWTESDQKVVRQCLHFDWNRRHEHIESPLMCFASEVYEAKYMHPVEQDFAHCLRFVSRKEEHLLILPIMKEVFARLEKRDSIGVSLLYPVLRFFIDKTQRRERPELASKGDRAMLEVKHYVDTHFREEIDMASLAKRARLTTSHFCQAFKKCIGRSPLQYLNQLRIDHACRLLREEEMRVGEVGRAVGFPSLNYFVRVFKKHKGLPPGAWTHRTDLRA